MLHVLVSYVHDSETEEKKRCGGDDTGILQYMVSLHEFSSPSSCFHNLFSGQLLWFLQCQRVIGTSSLAAIRVQRSAKNRGGGVVGYGGGSAARRDECVGLLGLWLCLRRQRARVLWWMDAPGRFPLEGVRRETGCLSLEKLPNPPCQFRSCCWCMMGKKNIPPFSLSSPVKSTLTWIQIQTNNTRLCGRVWLFEYSLS